MSGAAIMLAGLLIDAAIGWPDRIHRRIGHPVTWACALIAALDEDEARAAERRLNNALVALQRSMEPMVDVNTALVRMFNQRLPDYTVGLLATLKELDTSGSLRAHVSIRRFSLDNEGKRRYEEPTLFD